MGSSYCNISDIIMIPHTLARQRIATEYQQNDWIKVSTKARTIELHNVLL